MSAFICFDRASGSIVSDLYQTEVCTEVYMYVVCIIIKINMHSLQVSYNKDTSYL